MPFARASELDRLFACAGSLLLPRVYVPPGDAAKWGTLVHSWLETNEVPRQEPQRTALRKRLKLSGIDLDRELWWPAGGEHEITYGLNLVTGVATRAPVQARLAPGDTQKAAAARWKEALGDEWVTGTLDYAMELLDRPWVDDLKTGRYAHWKDHAAQQTFYCVVYSLEKYGELRQSRSTLTHWPKYPSAGRPTRKGVMLSVDTLRDFVISLTQLRKTVLDLRGAGGQVELSAGDQCRYCPSRSFCPKHTETNDRV